MEKLNKLFSAAQAGNILELTQLVTSENVNEVNVRGFTAFLLAAKHADKSTLQWLIDNGADWKKTKDKGENALFYVVLEHAGQQADRIEKLQFLLSLGLAFEHPSFELVCSDKWHQLKNHWMRDWTYIDQKDRWGCSLLHYASAWGNLPAVKWLSDIAKLYRQHPDTLRGATPLHRASNCDQLEVVQWLVQQPLCKIAFTDKSGWTCLHHAASNGHLAIIKWLIEAKAISFETKDKSGWTCLHHAASNGHLAIIEWLIEAKGMSFETKDHYGWTCLHHAANKGYLIIVQWLVEAKRAVLEEKDNYGWGALHHAVNCGHDELTQWLLSKLVLLKEKDSQGDTPLFLALENNNLVQAELLINHMLIHKMTYELLNEKNSSQQTVWLVLAKLGHLPLLQRLFQIGASLEETDQFQNTALLLALKNRHWQVAEWLLVQGSSIDACNYSKQCCLDLAAGFLQTNPKFFERILEYTLLKTKLETLQLRHVALSEYCVELLVQHFINHPTLIHLHLIDIKELTQEHCEKLAIVVSQHKSLVSLKLENCQLTSALLQPILTAVTYSKNLKQLYLDRHSFTYDSYQHLKEVLVKNKILKLLSLNFCHNLTDASLLLLSEGLAVNRTLKELQLLQPLQAKYTKIGLEIFVNAIINHQALLKLMLNLSSQDFGELRSKITAFLARNAMKAQIESMAQWANIMRNVTASNEILYPELPSKPIKIPTLQGYCTFFVKQIGVVIKSDKDNVAKAYFNDEDLALSPIIAELIDTGEYEFVECMPVDKNLINYKY